MSTDVKSGPGEIGSQRAKVLSAAMQILSAQGAEKLSLRAIAESAGIGIASICHYFENKEELLNLAIMGFGDLSRHIISFQERGEYPSAMQASACAARTRCITRPRTSSAMPNCWPKSRRRSGARSRRRKPSALPR
ncbi:MAG: helix-turn-helix transcriptional regulator [Parvibaculum sp.]|nr:helix-turn-helix transcriptional regulator [Parvibaculum sp.]